MDKLENIGYGNCFRNQVDVGKIAAHKVARVVAVHKNTIPVFPDVKLGRDLLPFDQSVTTMFINIGLLFQKSIFLQISREIDGSITINTQ